MMAYRNRQPCLSRVPLFWAGHFSLRGAGSSAWLLILAGMIGVVGYLALYRGLESGHIGLVSAISACYGGVIAVPSVLLLEERLTAAAAAGVVATVAGVMLAVILLFRERLMHCQAGGAVLILAGLVLLGLGS